MFLHESSLDIFHEHLVSTDNTLENITVTVSRQCFCNSCNGKGFKHENLFGIDAPLRGPCTTCNGATRVRVPKSSQNVPGGAGRTLLSRGEAMRRTRSEDEDQQDDEDDFDEEGMIQMISLKCKTCHGTGKKLTTDDICKTCRGYEVTAQKEEYELFLPNGIVIPGEVFEFEGQGNQHRKLDTDEKTQGNLYIYLDHKFDKPITRNDSLSEQVQHRVQELLIKGEKLSTEPNKLYRPAITAFSAALALDNRNATAYAKRAGVHLLLKEFNQARFDAEAAVAHNDMFFEGFARLGDALRCLGRTSEAVEKYQKAQFLAPDKETEHEMEALILSLKQQGAVVDPSPLKNASRYAAANNNSNNSFNTTTAHRYQPPPKVYTGTFANVTTMNDNNHNQHLKNQQDLFLTCDVTVNDLQNGTTKTISVVRASRCGACCGTGNVTSVTSTTTTNAKASSSATNSGVKQPQQQNSKGNNNNNNLNDVDDSTSSEDDADRMLMILSISQEKGLVLDDDNDNDKNPNNRNSMMMMMMMSNNNNNKNYDEDIPLATVSQQRPQHQGDTNTHTTNKLLDERAQKILSSICPVCSGWGVINESKKFDVVVQPGTHVGRTYHFPNEGNQVKGNSDARGLLTIKLTLKAPPPQHQQPMYHHNNQFQQNATFGHTWNFAHNNNINTNNTINNNIRAKKLPMVEIGGDDDDLHGYEKDEDDDDDSTEDEDDKNFYAQENRRQQWQNNNQNTKSSWLLDLARKYNFELSDAAVRLIIHQHQIDKTTFLLMQKSDIESLGLPMGPRIALLKILENETQANKQ